MGALMVFFALQAFASKQSLEFSGTVKKNEIYSHKINDEMTFVLNPMKGGWEILVKTKRAPKENLARLTPTEHEARHNDRYIEAWNFAEKDIDGPGKTREFVFSPKVGVTIQNYKTSTPVSDAEVEEVRHDGHGILEITGMKLDGKGTKSTFKEIDFTVTIETDLE